MIEAERVDWRDILVALGLLNHAAERIGANADQLFRAACRLSEPKVADLIEGFVRRSPKEKNPRSSWGYEEVKVAGQVGLIRYGFRAYNPTSDLTTAANAIADFIAMDKYSTHSVEIGTEIPFVWLESKHNNTLDKGAKTVRACASVSARLRPQERPDSDSQMFIAFLAEMEDESSAATLRMLSQVKKTESYAMLGVAEKNLFCLVVARSWVVGVESFETTEKLSRFSNGLANILRQHSC